MICVAENEDEFSDTHTALDFFVLHSVITSSDFAWMPDSRAAHIGRETEVVSGINSSLVRVPSLLETVSSESSFHLITL